jgi:hypothetical protein
MTAAELPPPNPLRRVAYEAAGGVWVFRDPVLGGEWRDTSMCSMALRWGAVMFKLYPQKTSSHDIQR